MISSSSVGQLAMSHPIPQFLHTRTTDPPSPLHKPSILSWMQCRLGATDAVLSPPTLFTSIWSLVPFKSPIAALENPASLWTSVFPLVPPSTVVFSRTVILASPLSYVYLALTHSLTLFVAKDEDAIFSLKTKQFFLFRSTKTKTLC